MDEIINNQLTNGRLVIIYGSYFEVQYIKEPLYHAHGKLQHKLIALVSDKNIYDILLEGLVLIKCDQDIKVYNITTNQVTDIIFENIKPPEFIWEDDQIGDFLSDCSSYIYKYINGDEELYRTEIEDIIKEILYIKFKEVT